MITVKESQAQITVFTEIAYSIPFLRNPFSIVVFYGSP